MFEASAPFYPLSIGELVGGKYKINSKLGEGGMGVVFGASHIDLNCEVAIKVIRQELNQQPELIARLMQEARAAAQIRSEHVCRVLDVSRLDNGSPYVVMEFLEGRTLSNVIEVKGRLPERLAVDYLLQACEAIAEAHRAGIVHRDLKPENLFLAEFPDGRRAIKVLDFGISKATKTWKNITERSLTNPSAAMGSPHYMAPEQMTSAREVDARADIWALGAILYQLLTGTLAFDGDSLPAVCAAVLQSNPPPIREVLPDLSAGIEEAISRCLVKEREQRLSSVADFANLIAPHGSSQASLSVTRIRRLLEETQAVQSSMDNPAGTLLSPRQLPTPKTPVASLGAPPIETTAAVTSSKRQFDAPSSRRTPIWIASAAIVLAAIAGIVVATRPPPRVSSNATELVPSNSGLTAVPFAAPPAKSETPPAAASSAEETDAKPAVEVAASATTLAVAKVKPPLPSVGNAPKHEPRSKASASEISDPYNTENFGGRR